MRFSLLHLSLAAAAVSSTAASKILIPLYSWSEDCWPELQEAASSNPSAEFIGIINPDSGPVSDTSNPSLYCVPVLREKVPNLVLVGYVRTGYGDRSASDIESDVKTYASWSSMSVDAGGVSGTPTLDGIFFDESLSFEDSTDGLDAYSGYSSSAKSALGDSTTIIFNPGTTSSSELYDIATYVVSYEDAYDNFDVKSLPTDAATQAKSLIMLHSFPDSDDTLKSVVESIVPSQTGIWISDVKLSEEDIYARFGSNWQTFVADVVSANGDASSSTTKQAAVSTSTRSSTATAIASTDATRELVASTTSASSSATAFATDSILSTSAFFSSRVSAASSSSSGFASVSTGRRHRGHRHRTQQ
ncbi:hypothetical protein JCM10207_003324 [Rhodosporidiobolus poonsookiae]